MSEMYHRRLPHPVGKRLGVAHSQGITALFSTDPNRYFGFFEREAAEPDNDAPEAIDSQIVDLLRLNEKKPFVVVVEGSLGFLRRYENVREVDYLVFVSHEPTLRTLGVPIVDEGWHSGLPKTTLEAHLDIDVWPALDAVTQEPLGEPRLTTSGSLVGAVAGAVSAAVHLSGAGRGGQVLIHAEEPGDVNPRCVGRVEGDGSVYDDEYFGAKVGWLESDGKVWSAAGAVVGQVNRDGTIDGARGELNVARIDETGAIRAGAPVEDVVGYVKPGDSQAGGAGYLLLLH
jgi:hypothetical protein